VFDFDETLTLSTFMPRDRDFRSRIGWSEWPEYITMVNFESTFLESSRVEKMRDMLKSLAKRDDKDSPQRILAVLTKNEAGVVACLNLLLMAKLAEYFDAMWCMAAASSSMRGVYRKGTEWKAFHPPLEKCHDHKAEVLRQVSKMPGEFFPQLSADDPVGLKELTMDGIVLVDDVRTNFQSPLKGGEKVLRYCKVARYDSQYRDCGFVQNMGGIGARNTNDFTTLVNFVEKPWEYKAVLSVQCEERSFEGCEENQPVELVVFDFDETLSLSTFMPEEPSLSRCSKEIGYSVNRQQFVKYNFESPYVASNRVEKLREMLKTLRNPSDSSSSSQDERRLAVLTMNEAGAVVVLNLLMMADLASNFSCVWAIGAAPGKANGVYRSGNTWKTFELPFRNLPREHYKAKVLRRVVDSVHDWFPQLAQAGEQWNLRPEGIVLVDDERASFEHPEEDEATILRYCKVARYDDEYRDQGLLVHMGGIGAKTENDYATLINFVRTPWMYRTGLALCGFGGDSEDLNPGYSSEDPPPVPLARCTTPEDMPRRHTVSSLTPTHMPDGDDEDGEEEPLSKAVTGPAIS